MSNTINGKEVAPSIDVKNLSYAFPDGSSGLKDVFLDLPPGSRTLLIGGMQQQEWISKGFS
jgi:CCR4-NOT complex subunit CAF16